MANLIIDRGTNAIRIALIVKRRRNSAHLRGQIINDLINLAGFHAFMNTLFNFIQHSDVDLGALADLLNLRRCFDHCMSRHLMSGCVQSLKPVVHECVT